MKNTSKTTTNSKKVSDNDIIHVKLLGIEPFSINKAHYVRTKTRTKECREWGDRILQLVKDSPDIVRSFRKINKLFDPAIHCIHLDIVFQIPKEIFFTKEGKVSRRKQDLSNIEKMLIDILFDVRHQRGNMINLGIDDQYIVDLHSRQYPAKNYCILLQLTVNPL